MVPETATLVTPARPPQPRPSLPATPPDHHGALDYAELTRWGYAPDDVIDFSVNSNPFGTHPTVREAILNAPFDRYPDKDCLALRAALSDHLDISGEQIVVGNGTAELIWQIAFAYLTAGDRVGVVVPTFGEYARNCRLMGAEVVSLNPDWMAAPTDRSFRIVFICHPNNPTGELRDLAAIERWAEAAPQTLFVIDEAYLNFVDAPSSLQFNRPNLIILRSMTKDYALAGLRLGYAVAHPDVVATLRRVRVPWNVSETAQVAGVAALQHHQEYAGRWRQLRTLSAQFKSDLAAAGWPSAPSALHYFLVDVTDGAAFRHQLLQHGLIVRDCASFGLPQMVRIATRLPHENARLIAALRHNV